jgi:hypothetical protein
MRINRPEIHADPQITSKKTYDLEFAYLYTETNLTSDLASIALPPELNS